nr:DEAD/DEAH box helicase [Polyangiaceae bacterium]
KGKQIELRGVLERGEQQAELGAARLLLGGPGGVVVFGERAARFDDRGASAWVSALRAHGPLRAPRGELDKLVAAVLGAPSAPPLDLPEGPLDEVRAPLAPAVSVRAFGGRSYAGTVPRLAGEVRFVYDGASVPASHLGAFVPDLPQRRLLVRDAEAERVALEQLVRAGFGPARTPGAPEGAFEIAPKELPAAVRALTDAGWRVEAEGKLYRRPGEFTFQAGQATGVDWFELRGDIDFGGQRATLPALLAALDRDDRTVVLGDGSLGLLPEAWLKQWAPVLRFGEAKGEAVAYRASQAGLLDALLATAQEGAAEATIIRARERLPHFAAATEEAAPASFVGELRPYQRQGLGWLVFLERAGLGGCLADDMGLGKTVQVLALLERHRTRRPRRPSLVVVPRSLLFNWQSEAARFAPKLRVLVHTGTDRSTATDHLGRFDLVLTTYGTLRRDAVALAGQTFRHVVLDEAQAIKNPDSDASKAARLVRADHRLALTGTPVENHLGELWSLFEFLNPGMLGRASAFRGLVKDARVLDEGARPLVRSLLRPVLLRRTKAEVESDLPAKLEETVACELGPRERREYDALREHFRRSLLDRVAREGMARSKIHVLEALLRLRQAACHPGLLDPKRRREPSAKVDELLERLTTVVDGGHKALVFSQFTSLLAIVRARLDDAGVAYAYLDGKTRDRAAPVARFQTDPACPVFLISLKAGGVGLNLTAAEYVFLLDPWWNPAVEAQAIDRSHRIGQTRTVFAYRLLARDTVEEKVAELQAQKRALADAILGGESSPLGALTRDDLERLLS